MKKIITVAIFMLLLVQTQAQTVSVNYAYNFVSATEGKFKEKKLIPSTVSQVSLVYSQRLKKLPIVINVAATASYKKPPPPRIIPYPDPRTYSIYAKDNKIEADSAGFTLSNTKSIDFLVGFGYVLPHKESSNFVVIANADFGISLNNSQALNFYFRGKKTGSAEVPKSQLIINPNIKATYFVTDKIGIGLQLGYNNIGGANAGAGVTIAPKGRKITFPPNGGLR
jgi:hypothetical protein